MGKKGGKAKIKVNFFFEDQHYLWFEYSKRFNFFIEKLSEILKSVMGFF